MGMTRTRPVVAIVDDDLRLLESLANLLESAGYLACSFSSAHALLADGLSGLDALITDIGMPGMNGFELRDVVKKDCPDLPVFLMTGRHEIADQGRAQGISGFFRKPFDTQALLAAVTDAVRTVEDGRMTRADEQAPRPKSSPSPAQPRAEAEQPFVIVVDDDVAIRESVSEFILSAGLQPACFASASELLDTDLLLSPGCLILDVRMPGASGLDLQQHLARSGNSKPIIFLTAHGDIPMTVQAMKAGAVDFFTKPVRDQTLLDAVIAAIAIDTAQRSEAAVIKRNVELFVGLTPRERRVLRELALGRANKQIAVDLGISEVTVKLHRSNVMRKMDTMSIGELIRAWETLPASVREGSPAWAMP